MYGLKVGQFRYSGQSIIFHHDVTEFASRLFHSIDTIIQYVFIRGQEDKRYEDCIKNRDNVKSALKSITVGIMTLFFITIICQGYHIIESVVREVIFNQVLQNNSFSSNEEYSDSEAKREYTLTNNIYETAAPAVTFKCDRKLNIEQKL